MNLENGNGWVTFYTVGIEKTNLSTTKKNIWSFVIWYSEMQQVWLFELNAHKTFVLTKTKHFNGSRC